MKKIFFFLFLPIIIYSCSDKISADIIYTHAVIWTGDTANPHATCIAVKENKIVYVGDDVNAVAAKSSTDLHGQMLVPGFIDNHTHFLSGGYNLASVNLRVAKTKQEFINILKDYCKKYNDDRWILGGDWDHEAWGGEMPTKDWIDSVTGNHPVFLSRYDEHQCLGNSIALKLGGVTSKTFVPGGEVVKDKNGEPTGILKDAAQNPVFNIIPNPSAAELNECLQRAVHHAFEHGVTQVVDMGSYGGWLDLETYQTAYKNHQLDLRMYSFVPLAAWARLDSFVKKNGWGNDDLHWGGLKGFVDGSLGSTTAWFYKPYLDAPNSTGITITDTNDLRKWILSADSVGLHIAVHAIGDRANDFLLKIYADAEKRDGRNDQRFRIEHAQHLTPWAVAQFANLNVIASMQPYHAIDDGKWAFKRLDSTRLKTTYCFKSVLATGAVVTFGSDWTVAPLDPIQGIYAAVTRRTLDDKNPGGWYPAEKISVEDALRCYTVNNAYANFMENKTGILKAGMYADFTVLDKDLFKVSPENIRDVKVMMTVVNSKQVYKK